MNAYSKRGVKMLPTNTSRDVGMVDGVSDITGSSIKSKLAEKVQEQGGVPRQCNNTVNIRCLQDTLWIYTLSPSLHLATF